MTLENAVVRLVEALDSATLRTLLAKLEGASDPTEEAIAFPTRESARAWEDALEVWRAECPEATTRMLVRFVRSVASATERATRNASRVDVVWTGPKTRVRLRRTRRVLDELIEGAHKDLLLVSYVVHTMPDLVRKLDEALARGVRVSILFERGSWYGGSLSFDAARAVREALPGVRLLTWSDPDGRVHVKAVVADDDAALVTSANLTGAAIHRNMELGVLIRGGPAPKRIREHFDHLLVDGILAEA